MLSSREARLAELNEGYEEIHLFECVGLSGVFGQRQMNCVLRLAASCKTSKLRRGDRIHIAQDSNYERARPRSG